MKVTLIAVSAAFAGFVAAQTQGQLPSCATNCVTTLLPASCNNNPDCICKDTNFITNISCCVFNACPVSDQQAALNFAKTYCTPVGVQLPASAGCSSSASATATGSSSASASASASASSVASSVSASASSVSSSASSAAASATSRAAGEKLAAQGISLLGAVAGAVALL